MAEDAEKQPPRPPWLDRILINPEHLDVLDPVFNEDDRVIRDIIRYADNDAYANREKKFFFFLRLIDEHGDTGIILPDSRGKSADEETKSRPLPLTHLSQGKGNAFPKSCKYTHGLLFWLNADYISPNKELPETLDRADIEHAMPRFCEALRFKTGIPVLHARVFIPPDPVHRGKFGHLCAAVILATEPEYENMLKGFHAESVLTTLVNERKLAVKELDGQANKSSKDDHAPLGTFQSRPLGRF